MALIQILTPPSFNSCDLSSGTSPFSHASVSQVVPTSLRGVVLNKTVFVLLVTGRSQSKKH